MMVGHTNPKHATLKKKNENNGNDKRNKKVINLNCNHISSTSDMWK